jgi:hypothetical protein
MPKCIGMRHLRIWLVEKLLVHLLEEIVIVSVIYSNANQDGSGISMPSSTLARFDRVDRP